MNPDPEERDLEVEALLGHLDHAPPPVSVEEVIARAEGRDPPRWRAWAAGIVLAVVAAGAAYAAPGSPMRDWIRSITNADSPSTQVQVGVSDNDLRGLSFPATEPQVITVRGLTDPIPVRIRITEEAAIVVRSSLPATRFESEPGRIDVEVGNADTLEVLISRAASNVEIRTEARSLFAWRGSTPRTEAEPDSDGSYLLLVTP